MKNNNSVKTAIRKIMEETKKIAEVYYVTFSVSKNRSDRYHLFIDRGTSQHSYLLGQRGAVLLSNIR